MNKTMDEFIQEYFRGRKSVPVKKINLDTGEEEYIDTETGTGKLSNNETIVFPLGHADSNGQQLYQGDIVVVEISAKHGNFCRCGVIRTEGFFVCGIDYFDDYNNIEEEGDYIDDPYIDKITRVGDVFKINLQTQFNWRDLIEIEDEEG